MAPHPLLYKPIPLFFQPHIYGWRLNFEHGTPSSVEHMVPHPHIPLFCFSDHMLRVYADSPPISFSFVADLALFLPSIFRRSCLACCVGRKRQPLLLNLAFTAAGHTCLHFFKTCAQESSKKLACVFSLDRSFLEKGERRWLAYFIIVNYCRTDSVCRWALSAPLRIVGPEAGP